jgi:hypothetical protein
MSCGTESSSRDMVPSYLSQIYWKRNPEETALHQHVSLRRSDRQSERATIAHLS